LGILASEHKGFPQRDGLPNRTESLCESYISAAWFQNIKGTPYAKSENTTFGLIKAYRWFIGFISWVNQANLLVVS